jgi:protein gp37
MAQDTKIEWATATWNPWYGCHKVSPACDHCYAERWAKRSGRDFSVVTRSKTTFNDPLKWKDPERIFVCSLSDFFHPDADQWRDDAFDVMREADWHTYMLLTKRPERPVTGWWVWPKSWWIGVTTENQEQADTRIPVLLKSTAPAVRFVSCEPLLGPIDLSGHLLMEPPVDWVIVGGESGPGFRKMEHQWVVDLQRQCARAAVPFFFKQWSAIRPSSDATLFGMEYKEIPRP